MHDFKDWVDDIVPSLQQQTTRRSQTHQKYPLVVLSPVQTPWYEDLSPERQFSITSFKIKLMNGYLRNSTQDMDVFWSFTEMVSAAGREAYKEDALHLTEQ